MKNHLENERKKIIKSIAKKICQLRNEHHLSQREMASRADTTQPVIARLESGKDPRVTSFMLLHRLARAVNKNIDIIFS